MALEEGIVLLLLDALGDGLLVALREITRSGFALFAGFGAFQGDGFLHGFKWVGRVERKAGRRARAIEILSYVGPALVAGPGHPGRRQPYPTKVAQPTRRQAL